MADAKHETETVRTRARRGAQKAAEPTITLTELIRQLRKFEGQQILNAQGLALTLLEGAAADEEFGIAGN